MDEKSLQDALKSALDTWKFQIDSYWSRNSYFATFHSAIMAGVWQISKTAQGQRRIGAQLFCYAGMFLAILWLINNIRVHQYIVYWWTRAAEIEKLLGDPQEARLVLGFD
ncbi:MAG TPA: hypothetical protein VKQ36_15620, partial [Ktedonobacterales bacterium]|nr:hypothetical protein [Ktedonobacterales bacterium]